MNKLGEDNIVKISTYLDRHEVCRFSRTSKAFVVPTRNNMIWSSYFYDFLSPIKDFIDFPNDINKVLSKPFAYPPLFNEYQAEHGGCVPESFRDLYIIWREIFDGYKHSEISLIHNFWFRMESYLKAYAPDIYGSLLPPRSESQIDSILNEAWSDNVYLKQKKLPRVLRLLYRFYDGQGYFAHYDEEGSIEEWSSIPREGCSFIPNISLFGGFTFNTRIITNILMPIRAMIERHAEIYDGFPPPYARKDDAEKNEDRWETAKMTHDESNAVSVCPFLDYQESNLMNKIITPDGNILACSQAQKEGHFPCVDVEHIGQNTHRLTHIGYPRNVIDSISKWSKQVHEDRDNNMRFTDKSEEYCHAFNALTHVELSLFGNWLLEYVHRLEMGIYDVRPLTIEMPALLHQRMLSRPHFYDTEDNISGTLEKGNKTSDSMDDDDDDDEEEVYSHARRWKGDMYKIPGSIINNRGPDSNVFINLFPVSVEDVTSSKQGRALFAKYDREDKALLSKCRTSSGVTISVHQIFVPSYSYSDNYKQEDFWSYSVRMDLHKDHPSRLPAVGVCELVTRHWRFNTDYALGSYGTYTMAGINPVSGNIVDGPGVVGLYPRLTLEDQLYPFTYQSCTRSINKLDTVMSGHVLMRLPGTDTIQYGDLNYLGPPLTHLADAEIAGKMNAGDEQMLIFIPDTEFIIPRFIY